MVLEKILTDTVIGKIIDKVSDMLPMNEDQKTKLQIKLKELDVEELKADTEFLNAKKSMIDSMKQMITLTFPVCVWVLIAACAFDYVLQFYCGIVGREAPIFSINEYHFWLCQTFCAFLFTSKTIKPFSVKGSESTILK